MPTDVSEKLSVGDEATVRSLYALADVLKTGINTFGNMKVKDIVVGIDELEDDPDSVNFYIYDDNSRRHWMRLEVTEGFNNLSELTENITRYRSDLCLTSKIHGLYREYIPASTDIKSNDNLTAYLNTITKHNVALMDYLSSECRKLFPKNTFHFKED